jgi:hypothetical protein
MKDATGAVRHRVVIRPPSAEKNSVEYTLDDAPLEARITLDTLTRGLPRVEGPAVELFFAATTAWIADRSIKRATQPDRWTRTIDISFPVTDPDAWPSAELQRLLRFLTNDRWTITPYAADSTPHLTPTEPIWPLKADAVDLFSGGLDSYAFAASTPTSSRVSIGHWDMEVLKGLQQRLHRDLGRNHEHLRNFHVSAAKTHEDSSRSRGLLFATAAIAVATALDVPRLVIPENGFVALNVPLTPARGGALTTRSTHPHTLQLLGDLTEALGLTIAVDNPWLYDTKGDITRHALNRPDDIAATVSCSHPTQGRWEKNGRYGNCGYCYPCLVRRSGIEAANDGVDPTEYRHDPRNESALTGRQSLRRADIYALVARLATPPHPRDLHQTGPLPRDLDLDRIQHMRERSHQELSTMLSNGMTQQVRTNLGLA